MSKTFLMWNAICIGAIFLMGRGLIDLWGGFIGAGIVLVAIGGLIAGAALLMMRRERDAKP